MSYSAGHPVRPIAGRLALDFVNTADWRDGDRVAHEKIVTLDDVAYWMRALHLPDLRLPDSVGEILEFRRALRRIFTGSAGKAHDVNILNRRLAGLSEAVLIAGEGGGGALAGALPLLDILAISSVSILGDLRERERIKRCPGENCGWLFLDETRNGRRKWCMMETCGNRAKARRNYRRARRASMERAPHRP